MRAESGGGKQGLTFDDYGRKFVCTANSAVQELMYEDRYAARSPFYVPPPALVDVALEPGETAARQIVHRISPEDPWRRVRNRWRAEGVFAGPPPQPPTYLIGSAGVTVYRGTALPPEYRGDVFVGVAGNNLVHHRRLTPDGVGFRARRLPDESSEEFLASTDLWFRPVAFANGPDGALYIADFYREILDFSDGIPEAIKRFKDLNRGNDRGRIYRVVPTGFTQPPPTRFGKASTSELVSALEHPNAWHRETASRLLYERQDKAAIPALVELAERSASPLGRLHALYALDGMDALAERYVLRALEDPEAGVREHAVRLAERMIARGVSDELWEALTKRLDDPDVRVRYQLAFTLGEIADRDVTDALLTLVRKDIELPWMHVAALTSLSAGAGDVFNRLVETPGFGSSAPEQALLADLLRMIGHRNKGRELLAALRFLQRSRPPAEAFAYLAAFADGLQRADVPLALFQPQVQPVLASALREVRNGSAAEAVRVRAIELIGLTAPTSETVAVLLSLVGPEQPHAVTSKALAALGQLGAPEVARGLLDRWPTFTPAIRRQVLPVLLARPERAAALVEAIKAGRVARNELTPTQVAGLRAHRNIDVRTAAAAVFPSSADGDRRAIIQRYQPSLDMAASSARGKTTYAARCAVCHQRGADGTSIGPSVESLSVLSPDELLTHLIDPNRTVDARYRLYDIETTDGGTVAGMVEDESQGSVTVRQPFGGSQTLPRSRITRMQPLERSFMPEGLEEGLSLQDMADLLAFLKSAY